ncbi:unnamed protein product [Rotaria socialis]|uniref:Reverse transcriptase/retrotransposon-derived protein RNase H-like domain-containing protein n=1 Tax=Rotaria socialis TaxID=392032 RepID=A0A818AWA3_9BILA|nr:unnamed protein product [Rotaria socialis]
MMIEIVKTKANRNKFSWGKPQKEALLKLKQLVITFPLFLDYPDEDHPVILTTDASKVGVGETLQQHINCEIKNLYYHSQMTSSSQRRYDPIELEALAIWMCFQRMRPYLLGRSIIIYTDHCPLCQHNCLADYLSRHPIPREEEIFDEDYGIAKRNKGDPPVMGRVPDGIHLLAGAIIIRSKAKQLQLKQDQNSTTTPTDRNKITLPPIEEETDQMKEDSSQIIAKNTLDIEFDYSTKNRRTYEKSMIMREDCNTKKKLIYLPSTMINDLLQVYHSDPLSGHFGVQRTYF